MLAAVAASVLAFAAPGAGAEGTDLRIRVWNEGRDGRPAQTFTLRCDPAGGSIRQPATACRKLKALRRPFAPLPKDVVCAQIYGGPQEALVSGRHAGRKVWVLLTLRDGCRIERWRTLSFLTPGYRTGGPS